MSEYLIRKTLPKGIAFLAHVIIAAEKGMSDRLSYSSLFNLQETKVKNLITVMIGKGLTDVNYSLVVLSLRNTWGGPYLPDDEKYLMEIIL